jgi:TetR/AcrR family transcriptional regulator, cholesterol catabolism regulator
MIDRPAPAHAESPPPAAATDAATPRRRRRANETVPARDAELLRVAARIFRTKGYDATSVADIGCALGITKGSVYHYIDSKEDLLFRICKSVHDDANVVIERVEAMEGSPLERLSSYLCQTAASNARNVTEIAVYYHEYARLTGARRAAIVRERRRYEALLVRLIEDGKATGEIDDAVPTRVVSANLLAQVIWLYTWYREASGPAPEELGAEIARLALDGIAVRVRPDVAGAT